MSNKQNLEQLKELCKQGTTERMIQHLETDMLLHRMKQRAEAAEATLTAAIKELIIFRRCSSCPAECHEQGQYVPEAECIEKIKAEFKEANQK